MFRIFLIATSLFLTFSAHAQMGGMEQQVYIPDVDKESLILLRPDKWYPYYSESEQKVDTFYFPTGQKPEKWKEALQAQSYMSTLGVTEAIQVYQVRTQANAKNCSEHKATLISDDIENGYSKTEWAEQCFSENDTEIVTLNKVLLGNEQLFVVSKIWKYAPDKNDMEEWQGFMSQVYVCDPTTGENPCRPPGGPQGGEGRPR